MVHVANRSVAPVPVSVQLCTARDAIAESLPRAERRVVFLDIDGTYASHGVVPPAHVSAVRAARSAGHLVFLCTGRPIVMVPPRLLAAGFDGVVASAGGYVLLRNEVYADTRFPAALATRALDALDADGVSYVLEAPEALYGAPGLADTIRRVLRETGGQPGDGTGERRGGLTDILECLTLRDDLRGASFAKIICIDPPVPVARLAGTIGGAVAALPSSITGLGERVGELYLADVHKAVGMQVVVDVLGKGPSDVVAVGDGLNDLEMLEYAGLAVAIEGADPRVLAVADRTAPPPERDGLALLFAELGLL